MGIRDWFRSKPKEPESLESMDARLEELRRRLERVNSEIKELDEEERVNLERFKSLPKPRYRPGMYLRGGARAVSTVVITCRHTGEEHDAMVTRYDNETVDVKCENRDSCRDCPYEE